MALEFYWERDYNVYMAAARTALDGLLDPFSRCMDQSSALRIAEFRADSNVQARVDTLADRANEGLLNEDERSEYESLINAADVISILKLKAARYLQAHLS